MDIKKQLRIKDKRPYRFLKPAGSKNIKSKNYFCSSNKASHQIMRIKEILKSTASIGKEVEAKGWVRTKRGNKNIVFVALNDGSILHNIQVVIDASAFPEDLMKQVTTGACIAVKGILVQSPGKEQNVEIQAVSLVVYGSANPETYPLQKKGHSLEFLRTIAHLRPRTNTFGAVARVRNCVCNSIHQFFQERGFLYGHTPSITASDCEGAGAMFQVTTILGKTPQISPLLPGEGQQRLSPLPLGEGQ